MVGESFAVSSLIGHMALTNLLCGCAYERHRNPNLSSASCEAKGAVGATKLHIRVTEVVEEVTGCMGFDEALVMDASSGIKQVLSGVSEDMSHLTENMDKQRYWPHKNKKNLQ